MEVIQNMPFEEYAERPGINASLLKIVHRKSLLHARAYLDGDFKEESDALDFGKCFHSLALEDKEVFSEIPQVYTNEKGEVKPWNWNANVCKAWGNEQGERIPLKHSEVAAVRAMAAVARRELGNGRKGRRELSLFAKMPVRGRADPVPVKCRIDLLSDDEREPIWDPKSCESAEPGQFMRSALALGYDIQAAFTIDVATLCGFRRKGFSLLAVESTVPHASCIIDFADTHITHLRAGRTKYRAAMLRYLTAEDTGQWDGYGRHDAEEYTPTYMKEELERTA